MNVLRSMILCILNGLYGKGEINAVVSLTKEFQLRTLILSEHIIDAMNGIIKKKYF